MRPTEDERSDAGRVPQRELLSHEAAHREPEDVRPRDASCIQDGQRILGQIVHRPRGRWHRAAPDTAVVESDDAPVRCQRRRGAMPHVGGVAETLNQQQRLVSRLTVSLGRPPQGFAGFGRDHGHVPHSH